MQMIGRGPFPIMLLKDVTPQDPRPYLMAPNFSRLSFPIYADHQCKPLHPKLGPQPYLRAAGACLVSIQRSQRVTPRKLPNPYHTIILIFVNIIIKYII